MSRLTILDLENAKADVDHIAAIATSSELTATDRFGNKKTTIAGILAYLTRKSDRGSWEPSVEYKQLDVVTMAGNWYISTQNHISGANFFQDQMKYWKVLGLSGKEIFDVANLGKPEGVYGAQDLRWSGVDPSSPNSTETLELALNKAGTFIVTGGFKEYTNISTVDLPGGTRLRDTKIRGVALPKMFRIGETSLDAELRNIEFDNGSAPGVALAAEQTGDAAGTSIRRFLIENVTVRNSGSFASLSSRGGFSGWVRNSKHINLKMLKGLSIRLGFNDYSASLNYGPSEISGNWLETVYAGITSYSPNSIISRNILKNVGSPNFLRTNGIYTKGRNTMISGNMLIDAGYGQGSINMKGSERDSVATPQGYATGCVANSISYTSDYSSVNPTTGIKADAGEALIVANLVDGASGSAFNTGGLFHNLNLVANQFYSHHGTTNGLVSLPLTGVGHRIANNIMNVHGVGSDYQPDIEMTSANQLVKYLGSTYKPKTDYLPFKTTQVFPIHKFERLDGYVVRIQGQKKNTHIDITGNGIAGGAYGIYLAPSTANVLAISINLNSIRDSHKSCVFQTGGSLKHFRLFGNEFIAEPTDGYIVITKPTEEVFIGSNSGFKKVTNNDLTQPIVSLPTAHNAITSVRATIVASDGVDHFTSVTQTAYRNSEGVVAEVGTPALLHSYSSEGATSWSTTRTTTNNGNVVYNVKGQAEKTIKWKIEVTAIG